MSQLSKNYVLPQLGYLGDRTVKLESTLSSNEQVKDRSEIPKRVIFDLRRAGAKVTKLGGNSYIIKNIRFRDAASDVLAAFAESCTNDPLVSIDFEPTPNIETTCLTPSVRLVPRILREARSIRTHYAPLMARHFVGEEPPPIPGPLPRPLLVESIRHLKIALMQLCPRIQKSAHPGYPTLTALPSGSYICTVSFQWLKRVTAYVVCKP